MLYGLVLLYYKRRKQTSYFVYEVLCNSVLNSGGITIIRYKFMDYMIDLNISIFSGINICM